MRTKFIILLVIMMSGAPLALAQISPEFGLRVGGDLSHLRSNETHFGELADNVSDMKPGFTAGVFMAVPVAENVFVQPELLYSQKGGQDNFTLGGPATRHNWNLDYASMPLLLRYDIPTTARIAPSVYAGPYAAYAMRRSATVKVDGAKASEDIDEIIERWDYGASAGVDLGFRLVRNTGTIGVRYDLGLRNILTEDFRENDASLRTGNASVILGFRF